MVSLLVLLLLIEERDLLSGEAPKLTPQPDNFGQPRFVVKLASL